MKLRSLVFTLALATPLLGATAHASPINDPRIAINALNTPGDADSVFLITAPGSYYLEGPLTGGAGKSGIEIAASNVHVDLMGFPLQGVPGSLSGIRVVQLRSAITIRNGTLSNWAVDGVSAALASSTQLRDLTVLDAVGDGIVVGAWAVLERCIVRSSGDIGITASGNALVSSCVVTGAGGVGILVLPGSKVRGCAVQDCGGIGISLGMNSSVIDSTVSNCLLGIVGSEMLHVVDCVVNNNVSYGVGLNSGTVRGCTISDNMSHGIAGVSEVYVVGNSLLNNAGDGVHMQRQARIEANDIRQSGGAGVRTFGTGSYVVKNALTANGSQVNVPNSGNFVGTLVHANGTNGRNDPWANLYSN